MGKALGMTAEEIVYQVLDALDATGVPSMLVGSFSSNCYGIARSTQDADFVVNLGNTPSEVADRLGDDFQLDPQMSFETITGTYRFIALHRDSAFKVEFFLLSNDPHDQERFARRRQETMSGHQMYVASPEDVIVTKLRWSKGGNRKKGRRRRSKRHPNSGELDLLELRRTMVHASRDARSTGSHSRGGSVGQALMTR